MTAAGTDAAFLATIIERPDDDLPRLLYADWLEEHGQIERAEFIRVQCELANPPVYRHFNGTVLLDISGAAQDHVRILRRRERKLLRSHAAAWFAEPPLNCVQHLLGDETGCRPTGCIQGTPRRGFVEEVTMPWNYEHVAALRKATPLRKVRLTNRPIPGQKHLADGRMCWFVAAVDQPDLDITRLAWHAGRPPTVSELLTAEFPGVAFELPQVAGPRSSARPRRLG